MIQAHLSGPLLSRPFEYVEALMLKRAILGYGSDTETTLLAFHTSENADLAMPYLLRMLHSAHLTYTLDQTDSSPDSPLDKSRLSQLAESFLGHRGL